MGFGPGINQAYSADKRLIDDYKKRNTHKNIAVAMDSPSIADVSTWLFFKTSWYNTKLFKALVGVCLITSLEILFVLYLKDLGGCPIKTGNIIWNSGCVKWSLFLV